MQAPASVPPERLRELHIRLQLPPVKAGAGAEAKTRPEDEATHAR
jgi:hypothetical protein